MKKSLMTCELNLYNIPVILADSQTGITDLILQDLF